MEKNTSKDKNKNKNKDKDQEQLYCQCLLRKRTGNVSILDVSWIPVEFSIEGKHLKFWRDEDKSWDDGWIVVKVYGVRSESDIIKMDWDYRKFDWIENVNS